VDLKMPYDSKMAKMPLTHNMFFPFFKAKYIFVSSETMIAQRDKMAYAPTKLYNSRLSENGHIKLMVNVELMTSPS
jgi:hypothetical protein